MRDSPALIRGDVTQLPTEEVNRLMAESNHMLDEFREQLTKVKNRMHTLANKYRVEIEYQVGDAVFF